jgi:hypothetical protein
VTCCEVPRSGLALLVPSPRHGAHETRLRPITSALVSLALTVHTWKLARLVVKPLAFSSIWSKLHTVHIDPTLLAKPLCCTRDHPPVQPPSTQAPPSPPHSRTTCLQHTALFFKVPEALFARDPQTWILHTTTSKKKATPRTPLHRQKEAPAPNPQTPTSTARSKMPTKPYPAAHGQRA